MSELVSALWFEDVSFLNEQMLDTPVGRFSIRQMGIFLIFGFLAWLSSLVFADLVLKVVVACAVFFVGAALFTRKIKTVSPEAHLLSIIRRLNVQIKQKRSEVKAKQSVGPVSKSLLLSATLGVPVKVVGVLKSLTTGESFSGKAFSVSVNNTVHSKGVTDVDGCFCTYFVSDRSGVFQLDIQPEGFPEAVQQITVNVKPKAEEEKENAEIIKSKI